jgi:SAM-dependent methyltransferase
MGFNEHKQPFWDASSECYDPLADYYDTLRGIVGLPAPQFYQDLITDRTWSVLELGCGTGIITQALANRMLEQHAGLGGVRVVGIDASAEMLRIAAARDDRIEWIKDDMREPSVEGQFDLVVCCYHTLQYILTEEDIIRVFNAVRLLLQPWGMFAFDIYQPNFDYLSIPRTDHLVRSTIDAEGRSLELREDASYDSASRVLQLDWRLLRKQSCGSVILVRMRQYVGQYTAADVDRLLKRAGLTALARFGDVDRSPYTARSKEQVVICGCRSEGGRNSLKGPSAL